MKTSRARRTHWIKFLNGPNKTNSEKLREFFAIFFNMAQHPYLGLGHLIVEVSRSYSDALRSVGLFWKREWPVAETSTWQHSTFTRDRFMFPAGFEPVIAAGNRQPTCAFNRVATGIGSYLQIVNKFSAVFQVIRETETRKQD